MLCKKHQCATEFPVRIQRPISFAVTQGTALQKKKPTTFTCTDQYICFKASKKHHAGLVPAWQAVYFGMVIEPDEKIILRLCKVSLTPEYLAVY